MTAVRDIILVTRDGKRISVDVRERPSVNEFVQAREWEIVTEVDPDKIWPDVIAIEGTIPNGHCLSVPRGPGYDTDEWGIEIFNNSPCLRAYAAGEHLLAGDLPEANS